jgi:hypothetical protein
VEGLGSPVLKEERQHGAPVRVLDDFLVVTPEGSRNDSVIVKLIEPETRGNQAWPVLANGRPHAELTPIVTPGFRSWLCAEKLFDFGFGIQDFEFWY